MLKVTVLDTKDAAHCPIRDVVARFGDKWSLLILVTLEEQPVRFNEIKRLVGDISQKVLTQSLRALERDGYVLRVVHPVSPPKVEYSLTEQGLSLLQPIKVIIDWAKEHHESIRQNRKRYDETL